LFEELVKRRIQISLFFFIPLFFALFAFGPAYIAVSIFSKYPSGDPVQFNIALRSVQQVLLIGIAVAAFAGVVIAYALLQPIKRLKEGLQAISLGDLTTRLALEASREFEHLGQDFNLMVSALNRYLLGMVGGVITVNREGKILSLNTIAELALGYRTEEIAGQPIHHLKATGLATEILSDLIHRTLEQQKPIATQDLPLILQDGQPIRLSVSTSLLRDQQDVMTGVVIQFKDLVKLKQVQDEMQRADRLASLGTLAAGVAHEIRNPLGAIRGLVQLLKEDLNDEQKKRYAETIIQEVDRLNRVVADLLKFCQSTDSDFKPARLDELVKRAAMLAGLEKMGKEIVLKEDHDDRIPEMKLDSERLVQAVLNILLNAIQAIPKSGEVWVKTSLKQNGSALPTTKRLHNSMAVIEIGNTRSVIPAKDFKKIFDPFYTTKEQGTGLGLTIAHQIITAHGGKIGVRSGDDKTVFTIELPVN
jgi:two-component system sensor histidine kinase AtoS